MESAVRRGFSGLDVSAFALPAGDRESRKRLESAFADAAKVAREAEKAARTAERLPCSDNRRKAKEAKQAAIAANRLLAELFESDKGSAAGGAPETLSAEEIRRLDLAALDREEAEHKGDPRHFRAAAVTLKECNDNPALVSKVLPPALAVFMDEMDAVRRHVVGRGILKKVEWRILERLGWTPSEIAEQAKEDAKQYALKFPKEDADGNPINREPEHRKLRDDRTWRRRTTKEIEKARAYITSAVGSVGGPDENTRPNYVADYSVICYRAKARDSWANMERLRIVKKNEPTVQIEMIDAHKSKKEREMAKRRLLSDVITHRSESVGARAIWITLTLPGKFHPNPTNKGSEVQKWDMNLGPEEAMTEIQELYHQTMALLREKKLRPWGFWDAQAQQDGTPHRHILVFVHDRQMTEDDALWLADPDVPESEKEVFRADSEARILKQARAVADEFWKRFSSVPVTKRREESKRADRGCSAYVVGDDDERYAVPEGRDGSAETPASIVRYMTRYSARMATGMGETMETAGAIPDDDTPADDFERHAVWASERNARLHNLIGIDSPRSPSRTWDCIWKAAERGEIPDDPRMSEAVLQMLSAQRYLDRLIEAREAQRVHRENLKDLEEHGPEYVKAKIRKQIQRLSLPTSPENAQEEAKRKNQLKDAQDRLARIDARENKWKGEKRTEVETQVETLADDIAELNDMVTEHAYQAAVAMGFWADRDLHASERLWLREELGTRSSRPLPLPPIPLRASRENTFGEEVTETIGIAAPKVTATGTAGELAMAREALDDGESVLTIDDDGNWAFVKPSDDPKQQILLRIEEWVVVDTATAEDMVQQAERAVAIIEEDEQEQKRKATQAVFRNACEIRGLEGLDFNYPSETGFGHDSEDDLECVKEVLSVIPTDPRIGPDGPPHGDVTGPEPPG